MEHRYSVLRKHLDELGYKESLIIESVPLAERLLADLVKTTESLYHYKNVAQSALEERDQLQLGAEPYKCDNAKLVKECNDLHLAFLQYREQTDKAQRDLKVKIHTLERENQDLSEKLHKSGEKSSKTNLSRKTIPSKTILTKHSATSIDTAKSLKSDTKSDKSKEKHKCDNMSSSIAVAECTLFCLKEEVKKLRLQLLKQNEFSEGLKEKLSNREREINRLHSLLEGGRPLHALNKDCCYIEMSVKLRNLTEENILLGDTKKNLEKQLAESISKQHEAMKRALLLADRNKELERELRDLDQMALAVEEECNTAVRKNFGKVSEELQTCHYKITDLEKELRELKRLKNRIDSEFETVKQEKDNLHTILENTLDDKKKMTDRINQFTRIEHDLNLEIDRLMQTCTLQKRKIADLEYQLTRKSESRLTYLQDNREDEEIEMEKRKTLKDSPINSCSNKSYRSKKRSVNDNGTIEYATLDKLKGERDYFEQECQRLCDELNNRPAELSTRGLKEKEDQLMRMERDIQELTRDKHTLLNKLESALETDKWSKDMDSATLKSVLNRVEKERDLARSDVKRLEEERDSLRKRLKCATETHISERDRLQKLMSDSEDKLRQLEVERREMVTVQGSRRATINNMEDQIESYKSQLRTTQNELEHIQTIYNQIKTLQEQTDRALADTHGQLSQVEMEYTHAQGRIKELEKNRAEQEKELSMVKNDICVLKTSLAKVDGQRDKLLIELDNKTERIAGIEQEFVSKDNKLISSETMINELKKQLSYYTDEAATNEYKLKNNCQELCALKKELDEAVKSKNEALAENRRLQNDLTKACCDSRNKCSDLDRASREIDDLKTQLQQYVFEVKRAEDLISKKENERAEMLDQYRTLTQEANLLETNNHCLENGTLELKCQLTCAKDHINDLEIKVEQMTTLIKDYEKQISQLTCQIACLETQIKQHASANTKTEVDLQSMRELVCKLDGQKDKLMKEIKEKDDYKSHLERDKDRLKVDINKLQDSLHKEQTNLGSLENLLAESRQETVEQRLLNQELQADIARLKAMVDELQTKLCATCSSCNRSIHAINTVDVRLHADRSPRSISSIFTNIMHKKPQESILTCAPIYEENERAEMLDQYSTLTQDANLLETSNHCLETGTLELKCQLTAAKDHIHDLEIKVEQMTTLNKDYEKQISQLTCQIACLETTNTKTVVDLQSMRELVCELDGEKGKLVKEINKKDNYRSHLERDKDRLMKCINKLQESLHKEQTNLGSLENLLAESRQETVEQRLFNQELQADIARLKTMVKKLQTKLSSNCSGRNPSMHAVDVCLHTDPSPRSMNNIFTNIIPKKPQKSITICTPVYEISCSEITPRSKNKDKDDNDTYRSHTKYQLDNTLHLSKGKKSNPLITNTTDFTKSMNSNNCIESNTESISLANSRSTSSSRSCTKNKHK